MMFVVRLLIAVVVTEAIAEITTSSFLFRNLIGDRFRNRKYLGEFVGCGYCQSFWIGMAMAWLLSLDLGLVYPVVDKLLMGVVVHRLSNAYHGLQLFVQERFAVAISMVRLGSSVDQAKDEAADKDAGGSA